MEGSVSAGQIVVLNGAPRSGKSSIAAAIQERGDALWINLGVDVARTMTPPRYQPGIGLRPGEEGHAAAPVVPVLYAALYDSIAAHSRLGLNVVVDVGHHVAEILSDCARRLARLPVLFVGVRCPLETVIERRNASAPGNYATATEGEPIPPPILRWQAEVQPMGSTTWRSTRL
jgi:chloramphenicol 3-O phosphotransferase